MAEITVTIPNSTFTVTQVSSGIEVTTPTAVVVEVSSDSNTVAVTSTPTNVSVTEVGVTNTDQLIEGTDNLFFTNARADARVALGIAAINYPVDSVNGQTDIVVLDTDDISEGSTNLYYTTLRANTDFDSRLSTKTTDNLNEGSVNQYFTTTRARGTIQVNDLGGDGSLAYNSSTGVISYTGPSAAEVRAHFTAGVGIAINSGEISVTGEQPVITLTTSSTAANQVVDSFSASQYRTAKYIVSVSSGAEYHSFEILVNHNGTVANQTTYADLATGTSLAVFSTDINSGLVRLLTTPTNAVTVYKVTRTAIAV